MIQDDDRQWRKHTPTLPTVRPSKKAKARREYIERCQKEHAEFIRQATR